MSKLRFKIVAGESITFSPWVEESIQHGGLQSTAAQAIAQLRQEHPNARISIERDIFIPVKKTTMVRFKVAVKTSAGDAMVYYTNAVPESEAEALREKINSDETLAQFKDKTVTREVING